MGVQYEIQFMEIVKSEGWRTERFEFDNELAFYVEK